MELHVVSYGIDNVARPFLLFFSSENRLSWFRVWKSVGYGVSKSWIRYIQELDMAYWGFLRVGTTLDIFQNIILIPYLEYDVLSSLDTLWSLVSTGTDTPYIP
ncbi:hypothetical protein Tco_0245208 [Tanacetum coccineum]